MLNLSRNINLKKSKGSEIWSLYKYNNNIFRSNFSETVEVEITDININSSGTYYCQTEDKDGQRHKDEIHISVTGMAIKSTHLDPKLNLNGVPLRWS